MKKYLAVILALVMALSLAGEETMSVCQQGYDMGYNSVDAVVRALQGEKLDSFIDAGASVVDLTTAQARL